MTYLTIAMAKGRTADKALSFLKVSAFNSPISMTKAENS